MGTRCRAWACTRLGDLRRLPRSGLARRFGEALLDRAGPRPRRCARPARCPACPSRASRPGSSCSSVPTAASRCCTARCCCWRSWWPGRRRSMRASAASRWRMRHERRHRGDTDTPAHTELPLALAEACNDAQHLQLLLRERLARLPLPAPTLALRLRCDQLQRSAAPNGELFPTARQRPARPAAAGRAAAGAPGAGPGAAAGAVRRPPPRARHRLAAGAAAGGGARRAARPAAAAAPLTRPVWLLPQPLAAARAAVAPAARRPAAAAAGRAGAHRSRLVGRRARGARLLHRPGARRRAGVGLSPAPAAGRAGGRGLVPARPLRLKPRPHPQITRRCFFCARGTADSGTPPSKVTKQPPCATASASR